VDSKKPEKDADKDSKTGKIKGGHDESVISFELYVGTRTCGSKSDIGVMRRQRSITFHFSQFHAGYGQAALVSDLSSVSLLVSSF